MIPRRAHFLLATLTILFFACRAQNSAASPSAAKFEHPSVHLMVSQRKILVCFWSSMTSTRGVEIASYSP